MTSSTQFAALGYEGHFTASPGESPIGSGFSVSYDAAANTYLIDVPASQPGVLESPSASGSTGRLTDPSNPGQFQPFGFWAGNSGLEYTAWATYQNTDLTAGWMTFGLATPQSAVPVSGSATYTADAFGFGGAYVAGKATLQFDFGASTLAGTLDLWDAELEPGEISYGHLNLVNTVVGSGQFSGELEGTAATQHGSFNGIFTGPSAQELMARWTATYPNSDTVMYGIWVGKKN